MELHQQIWCNYGQIKNHLLLQGWHKVIAIWRKGADYILENVSIYIQTVHAATTQGKGVRKEVCFSLLGVMMENMF